MPRSKYTAEQRTEAVAAYTEHGATKASEQLDIPKRTILDWARTAGVIAQAGTQQTHEARAANAEKVQAAWGDYREREALGAGNQAVFLRARLREAVESNKTLVDAATDGTSKVEPRLIHAVAQHISALNRSYGTAIDKAELLSGRATARIEEWSDSEVTQKIRSSVRDMEDVVRDYRGEDVAGQREKDGLPPLRLVKEA